jgi:hypothetical protein
VYGAKPIEVYADARDPFTNGPCPGLIACLGVASTNQEAARRAAGANVYRVINGTFGYTTSFNAHNRDLYQQSAGIPPERQF